MAIRKRLGALAMAAMLPIGGATLASVMVFSSATPVSASACWDEGQGGYTSCIGLDPHTTSCDTSAYDVYPATAIKDSGGTQIGSVELRYSSSCGSNWSRTTAPSQYAGALTADIYNNQTPPPPNHESTDSNSPGSTLTYSYMLGGYNESDYACGSNTWEGSYGSACTNSG
jgi:hypothetical protein